jgi:hypothetical protein
VELGVRIISFLENKFVIIKKIAMKSTSSYSPLKRGVRGV